VGGIEGPAQAAVSIQSVLRRHLFVGYSDRVTVILPALDSMPEPPGSPPTPRPPDPALPPQDPELPPTDPDPDRPGPELPEPVPLQDPAPAFSH
jgi:hypothetical protein